MPPVFQSMVIAAFADSISIFTSITVRNHVPASKKEVGRKLASIAILFSTVTSTPGEFFSSMTLIGQSL